MNRFLTLLLLLVSAVAGHAAGPTLENFDQQHFRTNAPAPGIIRTRLSSSNFDQSGDTWTITNVSGATGASKWTNGPDGIMRILEGNAENGIETTNHFIQKMVNAKGAVVFDGVLSSNLVAGQNDLDAFEINSIRLSGVATPMDATVSLNGGHGSGQLLIVENYLDGSGFCILAGQTLWDDPTKSIILPNGDWCPLAAGEQIWLRMNGLGNWVEVLRVITSGPGFAVINPTDSYLPYRIDGTTFGDSPLLRIDGNTIGFSATNTIGRVGSSIVITNGAVTNAFTLRNGLGTGFHMTYNTGGNPRLLSDNGSIYMGSTLVAEANIVPNLDNTRDLGSSASNGAFNDLFLKGFGYIVGDNDGGGNASWMKFSHTGSAGSAIIDSAATGTGVARDFLFQSNGVTIAKINLNSGYSGAGTKYLDDAGNFTVPAGGGGSANWTAGGTTNSTLAGRALVNDLSIVTQDATVVPLKIDTATGHTNWLSTVNSGGTNFLTVDKKGNIGIGITNIFPNKTLGITRVWDRELSNEKAWINIGGLDTWPVYNHASEWWANTGTNDGVMDLSWLSSTAIAPTKDHVWSVGAGDASTYYKFKYDGTNRYQMDVGGNVETIGYVRANSGVFTNSVDTAGTYKIAGTTILKASAVNFSTIGGYEAATNLLSTDTKNTAFGYQAMKTVSGGGADSANSAFGYRSLTALTTGTLNTGFGDGTLFTVTTQNGNTAVGTHAGLVVASANNTLGGYNVMSSGVNTGGNNTAWGSQCFLAITSGSANTTIGYQSSGDMTTGLENVAVGDRALKNNESGSNNTAVGALSLFTSTTTGNNTALGFQSGLNNTGSGNVFLGYRSGENETGSNKLYIDNSSTATPLIGGDFATDVVTITGSLLSKYLISAKTADYPVVAADSKTVFTNEGTTAIRNNTLPGAAAGLTYTFIVQDTDGLTVTAAAGDTIRIAASVSAAAGNITTTTVGNTVTIVAINATEWVATSVVGTWTVN